MEPIGNGLILMFNGLCAGAGTVTDWKVLTGLAMIVGLAWMARLEVDDLDMRAAKPRVQRH